MIWLRRAVELLIVYVVFAELRYSASMRRRVRERNLNRPPAPLSDPDVISRLMWACGLFIMGCFIGGLTFHGCSKP